MKNIVALLYLCLVISDIQAQDNIILNKQNFKDVLNTAEDVQFLGSNATLNWTKKAYSNLFSSFGNLNKINDDIPIGDFQIGYNYSITSSKADASFGMTYATLNEKTKEFFMFSYMLSANGELKFYSNKGLTFTSLPAQKLFSTEKCPAIKLAPQKNSIIVSRNNRTWCLIINADTIKKIIESDYIYENKTISEPAPVTKSFSNIILLDGKQLIEFTNCSQKFYALQDDIEEDIKYLSCINGTYILKPICSTGNTKMFFNVSVNYFRDQMRHKVAITGITTTTQTHVLTWNISKKIWECVLSKDDYLEIGGEKYSIKQLYFKQIEGTDNILLSFKLSYYLANYSNNTEYTFDCDFKGLKDVK
jgi:hypothetical protein